MKRLGNQHCTAEGHVGLQGFLGLSLPCVSHYSPKMVYTVSRYAQEPRKYCWEITLQGMDHSCKRSVLPQPQPSPTHPFINKIPTLRTLWLWLLPQHMGTRDSGAGAGTRHMPASSEWQHHLEAQLKQVRAQLCCPTRCLSS